MSKGEVPNLPATMTRRGLLTFGIVGIGLAVGGCSKMLKQVKGKEAPVLALSYPAMAAHRGGLSLYPESTMKAFANVADEFPQAVLELDVRQLADGALAVFHDEEVDRIAVDARGAVAKKDTGQWRNLRIKDPQGGTAEPPALLEEVLDEYGGSPRVLMIERKGSTSLDDFLEALRPICDQVIVQDTTVENVRSMVAAGFKTLQLTSESDVVFVDGIYALGVFSAVIDTDLCQRGHDVGVHVWAWGDDVVMGDATLIEQGVDGFIVNNPRLELDD